MTTTYFVDCADRSTAARLLRDVGYDTLSHAKTVCEDHADDGALGVSVFDAEGVCVRCLTYDAESGIWTDDGQPDPESHTPWPWRVATYDDGSVAIVPEQGFGICTMALVPPERVKANANLIAAAPDLLEALETLLFACRDGPARHRDYAHENARAALAKARGK